MDLGVLAERAKERVCLDCGEVFETNKEAWAMEQWADHIATHQPDAAQWTVAYNKIQRGKAKHA